MELSADYEAEQKELKEKAAALQSELSKTLEATANAEKFMKVVRKYTSFEELTPTLLREFVEKIVIHESEALAVFFDSLSSLRQWAANTALAMLPVLNRQKHNSTV